MELLNINSSELDKMEELGRGACSVVYKYDDNSVVKVLNEAGKELFDSEKFSNIVGIENDTCVFPKKAVLIDGELKGYTMDYIQGEMLHEIIKKIDLSTLTNAIKKVENDLKQLSKEKILLQDLNHGGIMWDNKESRIKIIDTDFFYKENLAQEEQCYSSNITSFNTLIEMELGILNGQDTEVIRYLQNKPEYNTLYKEYMIGSLIGENKSVTELIDKAIEIVEKDFGTKVNNIEEMQQLIEKQKKTEKEDTNALEDELELKDEQLSNLEKEAELISELETLRDIQIGKKEEQK